MNTFISVLFCFRSNDDYMDTVIVYLHFLGIMFLMGALISKYLLLSVSHSVKKLKMIAVSGRIELFSLVLLLITGLLRWFVYGKGAMYYSKNPFFHTKLTVYAIVLVLAVIQLVNILKWYKAVMRDNEWQPGEASVKRMYLFLRIEILLVIIIPLFAVIVMRGV